MANYNLSSDRMKEAAEKAEKANRHIAAIQTSYKGILFRSRLEARWAVFFDKLGIKWEYESQGYNGINGPYLPDFVLPNTRFRGNGPIHVEVKGCNESLMSDSSKIGGCIGQQATPVSNGLLILGPVPEAPVVGDTIIHPFLYWNKSVDTKSVKATLVYFCASYLSEFHLPDMDSYEDSYADNCVPDCVSVEAVRINVRWKKEGDIFYGRPPENRLCAAYSAARSARFEHGESGGVL